MWRRSKDTTETTLIDGTKNAGGPRALSTSEELLLRAGWEGLEDTERANRLKVFKAFPSPAVSSVTNAPAEVRNTAARPGRTPWHGDECGAGAEVGRIDPRGPGVR